MWRNNNHHNSNNNNHRTWRPSDRGGRRPGSIAPAKSYSNVPRSNLPSVSTTSTNTRQSAITQGHNGLPSYFNSHARQSATTPGHNGFSGNSREDWGLMGDARPPTPSEGRAQYYHRVGPPEQQRTRTYDNGTALTFGPEDPILEAMPGAAFDDQFRQVDTAIRDLQVSNLQVPHTGTASNYPYRNFRTSQPDTRMLPAVRSSDGDIYRVVPSRNTPVEVLPNVRSCPRQLSELPGSAHPGHSTDTRFGEIRPNPMLQNHAATSNEGSQDTFQQDTVTQVTNAERTPNVASNSGDIVEGPIHESRGTFYAVRPVEGYPPPLPNPGPSNVTRVVYDIDGRPYEVAGYESGSMLDHHSNVANNSHNIGNHGYQNHGYGQSSTTPNVSSNFQHIGYHHNPGYGYAPPPPTQLTNINVTTHTEDIEEPRGRTIERDARYLRHHRRTAQRGNVLWAQELDDRNNADRARGETFLGGDVDSGELLNFIQFGTPFPERRAPQEEEGLRTPRGLPPPQFQITKPSPIATAENIQGHVAPQSGRASAPPGPSSTDMGGLRGYFVTPLYQALNAQDSLRRSSLPDSEGRSSSTDSNGENRIFGELAGTVRAPSQAGKGRKLWKKDSEDEDSDPKDRRS